MGVRRFLATEKGALKRWKDFLKVESKWQFLMVFGSEFQMNNTGEGSLSLSPPGAGGWVLLGEI